MLLQGLVAMEHVPSPAQLDAIRRLLAARGASLGPRALPLVAAALEGWGSAMPPAWWASQLGRAAPRLGDCDAAELSSLAVAAAIARHRPDDGWMGAFASAAAGRLAAAAAGRRGAYPPQALCVTLSALSQLGYRPPGAWLRTYCAAVSACLAPPPGGGGGGSGGGGGGLSPAGICTILQALRRLRCRPADAWLAGVCASVAPHVRALPDGQLLDLCVGLGSMRGFAPPLDVARALAARAAAVGRGGGGGGSGSGGGGGRRIMVQRVSRRLLEAAHAAAGLPPLEPYRAPAVAAGPVPAAAGGRGGGGEGSGGDDAPPPPPPRPILRPAPQML